MISAPNVILNKSRGPMDLRAARRASMGRGRRWEGRTARGEAGPRGEEEEKEEGKEEGPASLCCHRRRPPAGRGHSRRDRAAASRIRFRRLRRAVPPPPAPLSSRPLSPPAPRGADGTRSAGRATGEIHPFENVFGETLGLCFHPFPERAESDGNFHSR